MASPLSARQLGSLAADGYLTLPGLLPHKDAVRASEAFDAMERSGDVPGSYEPEYDAAPDGRRLRKLRRLLFNEPEFWGPMLNRAGVGDIAERLIGADAAVVFHAAFLKPARVGTPVALHQDQALWSRTYPGAFSVWVALTDVGPHNGGLFGCPGSHRGPLEHRDRPEYPWHPSLDVVDDGLAAPVQFVLEPGDAVVWDRFFAHGSAPNISQGDRRGMVVVFADGGASGFDPIDCFPLADLRALGRG